jgi:hypothetical protein
MHPDLRASVSPMSHDGTVSSQEPACPWENYLIGKKIQPERFLAKLSKGAITIPNEEAQKRFAAALAAKPARLTRFIELLQTSHRCSTTLRQIIATLTEASIRSLELGPLPERLDALTFQQWSTRWLSTIVKKPLKPAELNRLFLLLHFGWQREILEYDIALSLVAAAIRRSGKKSLQQESVAPNKTPLEVLLSAAPTKGILTVLVADSTAWKTQSEELNRQIQEQHEEVERLAGDCAKLKATITSLRSDIVTLKEQRTSAEARISELEKQLIETADGYQHKLDELRGKIRGILQGQITRWVQTALDAANSDPPFTQAIRERLEEVLNLIGKETQWLQPSA